MGRKEKIILFLNSKKGFCCDDCISNECGINPRQSVNQTTALVPVITYYYVKKRFCILDFVV